MTLPLAKTSYRLVSLSGGGYRAALYNAGTLRALHAAGLFKPKHSLIVNAVSGGALPAVIWREFLHAGKRDDEYWPENSLLELLIRHAKV